MKLLIEEYPYKVEDVKDVLDGLFTLQDIEGNISVCYVGYYYNPSEKVRDVVFVLPKVLINEKDKFSASTNLVTLYTLMKLRWNRMRLNSSMNLQCGYRAIVVFNESHQNNEIILREQIESEGHGAKKKANTWLDVILSLIRFAKENQSFFTYVLKNIHSGYNKINWTRTISTTTAVVQSESPVYINPVNKKRQINFDEELIVIFFLYSTM